MLKRLFFRRSSLPGWLLALGGLQYFTCFITTATATSSYSYIRDSISDLGATRCINVKWQLVCSPQHSLLDASLIALGLLALAGFALLTRKYGNHYWTAGLLFLTVTSICVVLVGLFPTNVAEDVHSVSSNLAFPSGVVGISLLVMSRRFGRRMGGYSLVTALVSFVAQLIHFANGDYWHYAGLAERVAADPQVLWVLMLGIYLIIRQMKGYSAGQAIESDG